MRCAVDNHKNKYHMCKSLFVCLFLDSNFDEVVNDKMSFPSGNCRKYHKLTNIIIFKVWKEIDQLILPYTLYQVVQRIYV